jgi:hypothetical protein
MIPAAGPPGTDLRRLPCDRLLASGGTEYMRRYYAAHGRGQQARFHHILASDPGYDLHDHPWDFVSKLLSGTYIEHTPDGVIRYEAPCVIVRKAEQLHRLELPDGPVWSYVILGEVRRRWGFMTGHGWVRHDLAAAAGAIDWCGPPHPRPPQPPRLAPSRRW